MNKLPILFHGLSESRSPERDEYTRYFPTKRRAELEPLQKYKIAGQTLKNPYMEHYIPEKDLFNDRVVGPNCIFSSGTTYYLWFFFRSSLFFDIRKSERRKQQEL